MFSALVPRWGGGYLEACYVARKLGDFNIANWLCIRDFVLAVARGPRGHHNRTGPRGITVLASTEVGRHIDGFLKMALQRGTVATVGSTPCQMARTSSC